MTLNLPEALSGSPDQEALALGLEQIVFGSLDEDERQRQASDKTVPPLRAFALLDASQSADIPICLEGFSDPARCLFDGAAYDDMAEVAPWLVELTRYSDAWDWFVEEGYGQNWGILIHSRLELPRLKTHLKKFLKIEDEGGERRPRNRRRRPRRDNGGEHDNAGQHENGGQHDAGGESGPDTDGVEHGEGTAAADALVSSADATQGVSASSAEA